MLCAQEMSYQNLPNDLHLQKYNNLEKENQGLHRVMEVQRKEVMVLRDFITTLELKVQRLEAKLDPTGFIPLQQPAHPQSLLKRKFVEEEPALPKASGSKPGWTKLNTKNVAGNMSKKAFLSQAEKFGLKVVDKSEIMMVAD